LALPAGWSFKESYTSVAPHGRANVIASSEPFDDASLTAEVYARRQHRTLNLEFPEFRTTIDLMPISIQGAEGTAWFSEFTWTPDNSEPVTQMQVYAVRPGRAYTATATALTTDFGTTATSCTRC
jgi:hypothetical protein